MRWTSMWLAERGQPMLANLMAQSSPKATGKLRTSRLASKLKASAHFEDSRKNHAKLWCSTLLRPKNSDVGPRKTGFPISTARFFWKRNSRGPVPSPTTNKLMLRIHTSSVTCKSASIPGYVKPATLEQHVTHAHENARTAVMTLYASWSARLHHSGKKGRAVFSRSAY